MKTTTYKTGEVITMTGISVDRITYAIRQGHIPVRRPHRYAHHFWTAEDVKALCEWFGVTVPEEING